MVDFKVGDKVRATEALSEEVRQYHLDNGVDADDIDQALIAREAFTVVDIDFTDDWPYWVAQTPTSITRVPLGADEIELVED